MNKYCTIRSFLLFFCFIKTNNDNESSLSYFTVLSYQEIVRREENLSHVSEESVFFDQTREVDYFSVLEITESQDTDALEEVFLFDALKQEMLIYSNILIEIAPTNNLPQEDEETEPTNNVLQEVNNAENPIFNFDNLSQEGLNRFHELIKFFLLNKNVQKLSHLMSFFLPSEELSLFNKLVLFFLLKEKLSNMNRFIWFSLSEEKLQDFNDILINAFDLVYQMSENESVHEKILNIRQKKS